MTVMIVERQQASPGTTALPSTIRFPLRARSTSGTETADFTLSLAAHHNVWFSDGGGLSKSVVRQLRDVPTTPVTRSPTATLVNGPGAGGFGSVRVTGVINQGTPFSQRVVWVIVLLGQ